MPFKQKVKKIQSSLCLTPEAWAILEHRSSQAGLSKSEYVENLVRRGDSSLYDAFCKFLTDYAKTNTKDIEAVKQQVEVLETHHQTIKQFLTQIGISPNQIPD